ncbi:MAG TPA: YcnI family protein [Solirubrobacteraceae bacterium]
MIRRLTLAALLLLPPPATADAHVTLQPKEVQAGAYTVANVRVPNERDDTATTKVDVRFPPGFEFASYAPVPGWRVKVVQQAKRVARVTFTAVDGADAIKPGQFRDFPLSLKMPDKPTTLTFKALQTYSDGEVVRWIGPEESDEPAPVVKVVKAVEAAPVAVRAATDDDSDSGTTLAIVALVLAAASLGLTLARFRRA